MTPERRRQGRAIRKHRREVAAAFAAVDWEKVQAGINALGEALVQVGQMCVDVAVKMVEFFTSLLTPEFVAAMEEQAWKVHRAETLVNQDC